MYRIALLAALLSGCTTAVAPPPRYDSISFELKSWGRPIGGWSVGADGSGHYTEMQGDRGAPFGAYSIEHREFAVDRDGFARLAAMAADLPSPRPDRESCAELVTDLPYGRLRLTGGDSSEDIDFDSGCRDAPYEAFVAQLRAMHERVTAWAKAHPVIQVERIGEP